MTPRRKARAKPRRSAREPGPDHPASDNDTLVRLRPFSDADASWLEGWLGAVASAGGYDPIDRAEAANSLLARLRDEPSLRARIIEREGVDAGIILYRVHAPHGGDAMFELVAVPDAHARRGSGMMAAAVAERELLELGVRTVYAPAAEVHGIAVYFWIRLGYAPLQRGDWPCERPGVLWLRRDIPSPPATLRPSLLYRERRAGGGGTTQQ